MSKTLTVLAVFLVLAGAIAYVVFNNDDNSEDITPSPFVSISPSVSPTASPSPTAIQTATTSPRATISRIPTPTKTATPVPTPTTFTIRFTNAGVTPKSVTAKIGDSVRFVNEDSEVHLPKSDPHPIHTTCPEMNAPNSLATGQSFTFTVQRAKTCEFHDHHNPFTSSFRGNVIGKE